MATPLTPDEATAAGVDPDRAWYRVQCPEGHPGVISDNPDAGTVFECNGCGGRKYIVQAAPAPEPAAAEAEAAPAVVAQ